MSLLERVELAPADPILGLTEAFTKDDRREKVNLGVGVYLDENGQLPLLDCVRGAGERLGAEARPHGYLGIVGLPAYNEAVKDLVFKDAASDRVVTVQTLGGTGALRTGADFLEGALPGAPVYISDPSWENHRQIFTRAGFDVRTYPYYDAGTRGIDLEGMLAALSEAPQGSIVVLHACCHNPTGYDLTPEQWGRVVDVVIEKGHMPFVDMAYQGFAEGLEPDGAIVGRFMDTGVEFVVATSFSKSLALYGQRVGAFHLVAADAETARRSLSQIKICIRTTYSNPPSHGAALATEVLTDAQLRAGWESELAHMRDRIRSLREQLVARLEERDVTDMGFIAQQRGMFSYCGLTAEQMGRLRTEFGVYGTNAGRICVAALNDHNLDHVADAIAAVR